MAKDHGVDVDTLNTELERLLSFGHRFPDPRGGAAWLSDDGSPDPTRPTFTYITARMTHVYAVSHLLDWTGGDQLASLGLAGLTGRLRDSEHGGWFTSIDPAGEPSDEKACYTHAFVVLAASSAVAAGVTGADDLLTEALDTWLTRFFLSDDAMFADSWNGDFSVLDPYRGVNANMHSVEALLAAADVLDDQRLRDQALGVSQRVACEFAEPNGWRIPEHFDTSWRPMLEHHRDRPDDPFQPYGATVGHGLEWSRLLLHLEAALGEDAPDWLLPAATALFDRAVTDGWSVDGQPGFVYTTDWSGQPVVRDRMHWVLAEGLAAAAALHMRTGDPRYPDLTEQWWQYGEEFVFDYQRGSWRHQLDANNAPIGTVWPGKPDLYHAVQAVLVPQLPLAPTMATAVAQRQRTDA